MIAMRTGNLLQQTLFLSGDADIHLSRSPGLADRSRRIWAIVEHEGHGLGHGIAELGKAFVGSFPVLERPGQFEAPNAEELCFIFEILW